MPSPCGKFLHKKDVDSLCGKAIFGLDWAHLATWFTQDGPSQQKESSFTRIFLHPRAK